MLTRRALQSLVLAASVITAVLIFATSYNRGYYLETVDGVVTLTLPPILCAIPVFRKSRPRATLLCGLALLATAILLTLTGGYYFLPEAGILILSGLFGDHRKYLRQKGDTSPPSDLAQ